MKDLFLETARELAYPEEEITAGILYADRKARRDHPPGTFDSAGRFFADERSVSVIFCRRPTRLYPYSQMRAARTADHCADVCDALDVTHVRRIAKAYEAALAGEPNQVVRKKLAKGVRKRLEEIRRRAFTGFSPEQANA